MSLWFGYEWEIAVSASHADGSTVEMKRLLGQFDDALVRNMRHVDGMEIGWWLESGGRFYRDASEGGQAHNEYSSPECDHPDELLRHSIAADRMMLGLAELIETKGKLKSVRVSKANVSYASGESWGSHENYETEKPVPEQPMLAWLASRILMTGAGGLDVTYPGIRFTLSPRAHFIEEAVSNQTQHRRALHNVGKADPHGSRHRVHVIAGDGNRSPLSTWLRFATTALVVRMLDLGRIPHPGLADPVDALHRFALDPGISATVPLLDGSDGGVLDIQRSFLVSAMEDSGGFPNWACRVLREWQRVLENLARPQGWRALVGQLDWPTKLALFERILERRGWTWDRIREVNGLLERSMNGPAVEAAQMSHEAPYNGVPYQHVVMQIAESEHDPALIREFAGLKRLLAEADARYMELGRDSLYDRIAMPVDGLASPRIKTMTDPLALPMPKSGRARVRSKLIRKLGWKFIDDDSGKRNISAAWTYFRKDGKYLFMPDVDHADKRNWGDCEPSPRQRIRCNIVERRGRSGSVYAAIQGAVDAAVHGALDAVDSGFYADGCLALCGALEASGSAEVPAATRIEFWRQMVRLCARNQNQNEVDGAIQSLRSILSDDLDWLWEACNARVLLGLAGHNEVPGLAERVRNEMERRGAVRPSGSACWKSYMALWLNRHQRPNEALRILQPVLNNGEYASTSFSVQARIHSQFAEAHRMLGDFQAAAKHLEDAEKICEAVGLAANLLDYVLPGWARLFADQGDREKSCWMLTRQVLLEQRERGMPGALRTLILCHRVSTQDEFPAARNISREFITDKAGRQSGLASCPRLAKVLAEWDAWCEGAPDPAPSDGAEVIDFFWGV